MKPHTQIFLERLQIWDNYSLSEFCTFSISGRAIYYDLKILRRNYRFHSSLTI